MTIKEGVSILNKSIPKEMDAMVVLLTECHRDMMTREELERLDVLRGEKLNLSNNDFWSPETITKEDAALIRRGLDMYRRILWELNKERLMEEIRQNAEKERAEENCD